MAVSTLGRIRETTSALTEQPTYDPCPDIPANPSLPLCMGLRQNRLIRSSPPESQGQIGQLYLLTAVVPHLGSPTDTYLVGGA